MSRGDPSRRRPPPGPAGRPRCAALALFAALGVQGLIGHAAAAPPDDWTLETRGDDERLVEQRLRRLRERPFDTRQWRALQSALGKVRLAARLARLHAARPDDPALGVLHARALRSTGELDEAAQVLAKTEPQAGKLRAGAFDLRIEILLESGRDADARRALSSELARLEGLRPPPPPARARAIAERALRLAERSGDPSDALRLATRIEALSPGDPAATAQLAAAATRAGEFELADRSYARAVAQAPASARWRLTVARADALSRGQAHGRAAQQLWGLVSERHRGSTRERADVWEALVSAHRQAGSSEHFATQLDAWLASTPAHRSDASAWWAMARTQEALGRDPLPAWEAAVSAMPGDEGLRMGLVEALELRGEVDAAVERFGDFHRGGPLEVRRGLALAERLLVNGERSAGLAVAEVIARRSGKKVETLTALLDFYNEHERADDALAIAERLVAARPRDPDARVAVGEQLYAMGRLDEALAQWDQLPRLTRPAHAGWARRAQLLAEHAATARNARLSRLAVEALEQALRGAPDEPTYLRLKALIEEEQRDYIAALASWQAVRRHALGPANEVTQAEARTRVVELLVGGQLRKQTAALREAARREALEQLEAAPGSPEGRDAGLFLAELYTREERYHEAAEALADLVHARPDDSAIRMDLARAQRRAGRDAAAMDTLHGLVDDGDRRRGDALSELSELALAEGDDAQALAAAREAARKGQDGGRALLRLAELYEGRGELEAAITAYAAASAAIPGDPQVLLRRADLDLRRGETGAAVTMLSGLIESGPPPEIYRAATERLLDAIEQQGGAHRWIDFAVTANERGPDRPEAWALLLGVLERSRPGSIERWLDHPDASPDRTRRSRHHRVRVPLLAALGRGPIADRLRAAELLASLSIEDTALPLARVGVSLAAPSNSPRTVKAAYDRVRVASLHAAGTLDDPAALEALVRAAGQHAHPESRQAALWALAVSEQPAAAAALRAQLARADDRTLVTVCLGLATGRDPSQRAGDLVLVDGLARDRPDPHVARACALAAASLTPTARLDRLLPDLRARDPRAAAAAAWRLGTAPREALSPDALRALWHAWLGPPGLEQRAATQALSRIYGTASTAPSLPAPPRLDDAARWKDDLERWWVDTVADDGRSPSTKVELLQQDREMIWAAWEALAAGTPAERAAAERARQPCPRAPSVGTDRGGRGAGDVLCLADLATDREGRPLLLSRPPRPR